MKKIKISSKLESAFMLLMRLIAIPFMLTVVVIFKVAGIIKFITYYIAYGGEIIVYMKEDRVTISDIFEELKKQKN